MLSLSSSLSAHPPSSRRAEFSRARTNIIFLLFSDAVISPAPNRVPAEAQRGERQPHRRAAGRSRRVTPLRGGRPLEHHHVPARARGVSTPRGEESKQAGLATPQTAAWRKARTSFFAKSSTSSTSPTTPARWPARSPGLLHQIWALLACTKITTSGGHLQTLWKLLGTCHVKYGVY